MAFAQSCFPFPTVPSPTPETLKPSIMIVSEAEQQLCERNVTKMPQLEKKTEVWQNLGVNGAGRDCLATALSQWSERLVICAPTLNTVQTVLESRFLNVLDDILTQNPKTSAQIIIANHKSPSFYQLQPHPKPDSQSRDLDSLRVLQCKHSNLTIATYDLPFYHSIFVVDEAVYVCDHFLGKRAIDGWLRQLIAPYVAKPYLNEVHSIMTSSNAYKLLQQQHVDALKFSLVEIGTNVVLGQGNSPEAALDSSIRNHGDKYIEDTTFRLVSTCQDKESTTPEISSNPF